ncbi:Asp-tRNA(Asn)/Glu-tRNA(Gln) amidotransferase subunit GatC [Ferroacidibacillus organovorans]|uniref:Aspartyl/glutamyl-tRNA(Asn/Gln) amidotransferase subunit C n=1 Tax=Ferroacidibacillus organovorans TaxID=1765683 RepID=A0A162UVE6_9BACL|nr:Asp-tRNA(Asn)/Glu-tRNA(Gln) amidotransferase subunit GatC [Ferroacidibacillus organovorans]KYP82074.1 asparaginyl/glutamyl-tRNA amidotransferase subunit C [Ferroacidibacillus organovorans]OAG94395.1 glutamyl-tRNA amidotransferase [Ferroacidibacillus organovorans]OPG14938.1 aspartyl/glutamyl-tRNA(Asn/Gln) amidotransferase subunit C [Ferroacidibacillus organovorans]
MNLSIEDVYHVANLARIAISEDEAGALVHDLGRILEYAETLQSLDVTDVQETSHIGVKETVTRADEPRPSLGTERAVANAPDEEDGQFRVPAVLEGASS